MKREQLQDTTILLDQESTDETILLSDTTSSNGFSKTKGIADDDVLLNRYRVLSKLGEGGMGTVYLVEDDHLNKKNWALKEVEILPQQSRDFLNEAKILSTLEHPYLPKIVDYRNSPIEDNKAYLVMDYIQGKTLEQVFVDENRDIALERVIKYAIQICDVFSYLHNQKPYPIIYRDLKPSNVMLTENDEIRLIDFGIARQFNPDKKADTIQIGSVGFASPEQFENRQTDHRSDMYSLGAMLYYLLSGGGYIHAYENPFEDRNQRLPNQIIPLLKKLTAINPKNRYNTIEEVRKELENLLSGDSIQSKSKNIANNKFIWISVIAAAIILLVSVSYNLIPNKPVEVASIEENRPDFLEMYFEKIKYGLTREEVTAIMVDQYGLDSLDDVIESSADRLKYKLKIADFDSNVEYYFRENELIDMDLLITPIQEENYVSIKNKLIEELTARIGAAPDSVSENNAQWKIGNKSWSISKTTRSTSLGEKWHSLHINYSD